MEISTHINIMKISKKLIAKMEALPVGNVKDKKGNLLSSKYSSGYWIKYKRDEKGNVLSIKDSDGFWCKYKRDENGNTLSFKNSYGMHTY